MTLTHETPQVPDRILRAATELFSRQGYHGTSTREISRLSDVSEVTIFRHFETKENIFWSVLRSSFDAFKSRLELFDSRAQNQPPEEVLPQIFGILVDIVTYSPELLRLAATAFIELRGKNGDTCYKQVAPFFTAIARYLKTNMENGELRNLDPVIITAAMTLTVIAQPELSKLIEGCKVAQYSARETIDEYSTFWLKVLMPFQKERIQAANPT